MTLRSHSKGVSSYQNTQWEGNSTQVKCGYIINTVLIKINCSVIIKIANPNAIKPTYNLKHQVKFCTIVATSSHYNPHIHLIDYPSEKQFIPHQFYHTCWITRHFINLSGNRWTKRWWFQGHLLLWVNKFSWGNIKTGCFIVINTVRKSGESAKWRKYKMTLFMLNSLKISSKFRVTLKSCY